LCYQQIIDVHGDMYISLQANNTGNTPSYGTTTANDASGYPYYGTPYWALAGNTLEGIHPNQSVHDRGAYVLYCKVLEFAQ
jgi:hypothetical protein